MNKILKNCWGMYSIFATILFLAFLASCQSKGTKTDATQDNDTLVVTHKLGKTTIPAHPKRIVVLDIGALETLHELGVQPAGIPKKFMPPYLSALNENDSIADVGSVIEPDFEAISAVHPDLILMSTRQERFYSELSEIAPAVFIGIDNKDYIPSFEQNTLLIAKIVGKQEEAKAKVDSLKASIETARKKFEADPKKALFLIYNNGHFSAFGKGSRFGFIHDVMGIKPVMELKDESVHGQRVSNELVAEANPDYLFVVDRNAAVVGKKADKSEIENALIKQTKAYKAGKIFYLDPEVWFISGGGLTSVKLMVNDIVKLFQ